MTRSSARSAQDGVEEGIGLLRSSAAEWLPRLGRSPTPSTSGVIQRSPVVGRWVVVEAELLGLGRHLVEDGPALATLPLPRLGLAAGRATVLPWSHDGDGREMAATTEARNRSPGPSPLAPITSPVAGSISARLAIGRLVLPGWPMRRGMLACYASSFTTSAG